MSEGSGSTSEGVSIGARAGSGGNDSAGKSAEAGHAGGWRLRTTWPGRSPRWMA